MPLTVGVPTETKTAESRVALTPDGVRELERHGIDVFIQSGAGTESRHPRLRTMSPRGATIVPTAQDAWAQQMVVKVKEPQGAELSLPSPRSDAGHVPPSRRVSGGRTGPVEGGDDGHRVRNGAARQRRAPAARTDVRGGRTAGTADGRAILERHRGGRGVLMGGAPGVRPARAWCSVQETWDGTRRGSPRGWRRR